MHHKKNHIQLHIIATLLFFLIGCAFIIKATKNPIADFGNYYYGSKLYLNNLFTKEIYTNLNYFNVEIKKLGETMFFENYIPIPPISALIYIPLCYLDPQTAKLLFNVISLLLFCFSINKLFVFLKINNHLVLLLPFCFAPPIYFNIQQGQAYLIIISFIILSFIYAEQGKTHISSLLLSFCVLLKIFPIFLIGHFFLVKKYKSIFWTFLYTGLLFIISTFFIDTDITEYYILKVFPRLLNNDIIGPYEASNQSIYSLLLNLFTKDQYILNKYIIDLPILVPIFESALIVTVLYYLNSSKNKPPFFILGLTLFLFLLINRYNTSYSLILQLPFFISLLYLTNRNIPISLCLIILVIILYLPIINTTNSTFIAIKFIRIILILLTFLLLLFSSPHIINLKHMGLGFILVFIFKYSTFKITNYDYFEIQSTKGVLYDIDLKKDTLILKSTLGYKKEIEKHYLNGKVKFENELKNTENSIIYKGKCIYNSHDNILNPFLYNDTIILFMSDLNQGMHFYKIRKITIP